MTGDGAAGDDTSIRSIDEPGEYLREILREVHLVRLLNRPVVLTWWFLAANILFWGAAKLWGMGLGDQGLSSPLMNAEQIAFFTGMKFNQGIENGEWWRLISSQFVHLDIWHLLFNGYGIFVLGRFFERCYGWRRMLVLYVASGTVGAGASFLINPGPAGGASGAVYGLVGAAVVFGIKYRDALPRRLSLALTIGLVPWVILSLAIGFLDTIPMDNAAHIGGLATGAFLAVVMASRLRQREHRWSNPVVWGATIIVAAALIGTLAGWSEEATDCLTGPEAYEACYPELYRELREPRD